MVTLVERRRIRAAFLESVVEELHLANVGVVFGSVESLPSGADVCFARAFADARGSWEAAGRVLAASGRLIYFAGAGVDPSSLPEDAHVEILGLPPFASGGPLVIMSRQ
jgi:16S rRNA G527 N7-methylase RsmG